MAPLRLAHGRGDSPDRSGVAALNVTITADDEAFVDRLVPPGEHRRRGLNDPLYLVTGRQRRQS